MVVGPRAGDFRATGRWSRRPGDANAVPTRHGFGRSCGETYPRSTRTTYNVGSHEPPAGGPGGRATEDEQRC